MNDQLIPLVAGIGGGVLAASELDVLQDIAPIGIGYAAGSWLASGLAWITLQPDDIAARWKENGGRVGGVIGLVAVIANRIGS